MLDGRRRSDWLRDGRQRQSCIGETSRDGHHHHHGQPTLSPTQTGSPSEQLLTDVHSKTLPQRVSSAPVVAVTAGKQNPKTHLASTRNARPCRRSRPAPALQGSRVNSARPDSDDPGHPGGGHRTRPLRLLRCVLAVGDRSRCDRSSGCCQRTSIEAIYLRSTASNLLLQAGVVDSIHPLPVPVGFDADCKNGQHSTTSTARNTNPSLTSSGPLPLNVTAQDDPGRVLFAIASARFAESPVAALR